MLTNKLYLIFDGTNFAYKSLFAANVFTKTVMLDNKRDCDVYMRKLATDFAFLTRMVGPVDGIIYTTDFGSWRKEIDSNYKATRTRDNSVNWEAFQSINKEFVEILKKQGVVTSSLYSCEGDDLMYFWSDKLYNEGHNVILCTGDGDMTQLVDYNDDNFVVVFNAKSTSRQVIGKTGFSKWVEKKKVEAEISLEDEFDVFFNLSSTLIPTPFSIIQNLIEQTKLTEINPEDVLFEKIVCGDEGDNVLPILSWQTTQSSGKVVNNKITPVKAKVIQEAILDRGNGCNLPKMLEYPDVYPIFQKTIKQLYNKDLEINDLMEKLMLNAKLVYLNRMTIPLIIQNNFEKHYETLRTEEMKSLQGITMSKLLEGTEYYKQNFTSVESDLFRDIATIKDVKPKNKAKSLF